MTHVLADSERELLEALAVSRRGPKRNGIFGVWLFLRVCDGISPPDPLNIRAHRKRIRQLELRLSSLSLSPVLRKAISNSFGYLEEGDAAGAARALREVAQPAGDVLGRDVEQALLRGARQVDLQSAKAERP